MLTRFLGRVYFLGWICFLGGCQLEPGRDAVIQGVSMSPHFHGESMEFECDDCRFVFLSDVQQLPQNQRVVCPNCGWRENPWSMGRTVPGDACVVKDLPSALPRHQVVAIANDSRFEHSVVKRILGLPGESIGFQHGDLFVDQRLYEKSWQEIDALKILMFDSQFTPQRAENSRKRIVMDNESFVWTSDKKGWKFDPQQKNPAGNFWRYHHWRCCESTVFREDGFPIEDMYAANQTLSRDFFPMDDAIFDFDLELDGDASLEFATQYRGHSVTWKLDRTQKKVVVQIDGKIAETILLPDASVTALRIELATIDQQLMVRINGQAGRAVRIESMSGEQQPVPPCAVEIRARQGTGVVKRMRVWRDLYLFGAPEVTIENRLSIDATAWMIPSDHYFVIGDNLPNSEDSRHWDDPFVTRTRILGKVELVEPRE